MRLLGRTGLALALLIALLPVMPGGPWTASALENGGFYPIAAWPDGDGAYASPGAIATDASGTSYVADTGNNRVKKVSAAGEVLALWGGLGSGAGQFDAPEGVAVGADGRVFVADTGNDRVQVFDADGVHVATWGGYGTEAGRFDTPTGLAVDGSGYLYVSDTANGRIQKFDADGEHVLTMGAPGAQNGQLDAARGIAVDASGFLYVADANNRRVQKFSATTGAYVTQWGPILGGTGEPTGSRYTAPWDVATDGTYVYVADASEHEIERCSTTGASPLTWGTQGSGDGQLSGPRGIAVRPAGGVHVADTGNNRIETFTSGGSHVASWSGRGSDPGELDAPGDAAFADGGLGLVADTGNDRVQVLDASGEPVAVFGTTGSGSGEFDAPRGIAATGGVVWIADTGNDRLQSTDASGTAFAVVGSTGGGAGQFVAPEGVAVEEAGTILVADTGNDRIQRLSAVGAPLAQWGSSGSGAGQFNEPVDVAGAPDGTFYVVERSNNRVQRFDSDGSHLVTWGGWGTTAGKFRVPSGIAVGSDGDVYVADSGNDRIQRFEGDGTYVSEFGTTGAQLGGLGWPLGVDVAADGRVLVAERDNHRVQLWGHDDVAPVTSRSGTPAGWDVTWVNQTVTVTLSASDAGSGVAATYYRLDAGGTTTYTAPFEVSKQGETVVRYWSVDRVGNVESVNTVRVRIDSVPPSGTFVLAGGADYVTTTTVAATSAFTDALEMRFDTGGGYGPWVMYAASAELVLSGETTHTVLAQYRDWLGNTSTYDDSVTVDMSPPATTIDGVPEGWTVGPVVLSLLATDAVSGVATTLVSENGGPESPYVAPWTIAEEGTTTVTYRSIDRAGNAEETRTATVRIDSIPPSGTLVLEEGARYSTSTTVTATSQVTGAERVRFDVGGGFGDWEPFETTTTLALLGEGVRSVSAQYENRAGLTYETSATITVDMTPPGVGVVSVDERRGLPRTLVGSARVTWEGLDANPVVGYSYVIDRVSGTVPDTSVDTTANVLVVEGRGPGTWYVHVRARDAAGLWGEAVHVPVELRSTRLVLPLPDGRTTRTGSFDWPSIAATIGFPGSGAAFPGIGALGGSRGPVIALSDADRQVAVGEDDSPGDSATRSSTRPATRPNERLSPTWWPRVHAIEWAGAGAAGEPWWPERHAW